MKKPRWTSASELFVTSKYVVCCIEEYDVEVHVTPKELQKSSDFLVSQPLYTVLYANYLCFRDTGMTASCAYRGFYLSDVCISSFSLDYESVIKLSKSIYLSTNLLKQMCKNLKNDCIIYQRRAMY